MLHIYRKPVFIALHYVVQGDWSFGDFTTLQHANKMEFNSISYVEQGNFTMI